MKKRELLDEIDERIINGLKENSRLSLRQLSRSINIPVSSIHSRLKQLKEKNIITKFTIKLNHEKLGFKFNAYVLVKINLKMLHRKQKSQEDVAKMLLKHQYVERADIITGDYDLILHVRCKNTATFREFLFNYVQTNEFIENTKTIVILHSSEDF